MTIASQPIFNPLSPPPPLFIYIPLYSDFLFLKEDNLFFLFLFFLFIFERRQFMGQI